MQGGIAQVPVTCAKGCERATGTCANRKTPGIREDPGCRVYRYMNYLIYGLLKEVRVYISGNAGLRYEYPYVGCLAAVEGGSLYI